MPARSPCCRAACACRRSRSQVDVYHDLCLLHVRGVESSRAVAFGPPGGLAIGQPVTAVGHTAGALQSSGGEVLALHRLDGGRVIQSSNYFNSGASGGGLFDDDLHLVGILTFRLRGGEAHYFAMPAEWLAGHARSPGSTAKQTWCPSARTELAYWQRPVSDQPGLPEGRAAQSDGHWPELESLAADWARADASDPEPWYLMGLALARMNRLPGRSTPRARVLARDRSRFRERPHELELARLAAPGSDPSEPLVDSRSPPPVMPRETQRCPSPHHPHPLACLARIRCGTRPALPAIVRAEEPPKDFSAAERALFMTDQFAKLRPPMTLRYRFHRSGSLEAGIRRQGLDRAEGASRRHCCAAQRAVPHRRAPNATARGREAPRATRPSFTFSNATCARWSA